VGGLEPVDRVTRPRVNAANLLHWRREETEVKKAHKIA